MKNTTRLRLFAVSACLVLLSLFVLVPVAGAHGNAHSIQAQLTPLKMMRNEAVKLPKQKVAAATPLLPCLASTTPPLCYSPQQIRRAYDIQPLLKAGITGKGQTIVIIDDYQSPTLRSDLALFDQIFGLKDPKLNIIAPNGLKPFDPADPGATGFAGEISLDVEWAHVVAPDATIDLVLGNPADSTFKGQIDAIVAATQYAVANNLGKVLSLSVGAGESCYIGGDLNALHQAFRTARAKNISVFASSGDSDSAAVQCDATGTPVAIVQGTEYPASDPLVSGVGGTSLFADAKGTYKSETVWNDGQGGGTGGGFSATFPRPSYQNGIAGIGKQRGVPDVAYNADPATGVPIVVSSLLPGITLILPIGGTSAGAPQWAGIAALADQQARRPLGFLNGAFYRIAKSPLYGQAFHDITTGNNTYTGPDANGNTVTIPGYNAVPGWDPATGVGSPKVAKLVSILAPNCAYSDGKGL